MLHFFQHGFNLPCRQRVLDILIERAQEYFYVTSGDKVVRAKFQ